MAWRVVWTEPGWSKLEAAADYIAQDSPRYAASLVREARDATRSLAHLANAVNQSSQTVSRSHFKCDCFTAGISQLMSGLTEVAQ